MGARTPIASEMPRTVIMAEIAFLIVVSPADGNGRPTRTGANHAARQRAVRSEGEGARAPQYHMPSHAGVIAQASLILDYDGERFGRLWTSVTDAILLNQFS